MSRERVTAASVTQALLHRISSGQYSPGDRLPSIRELAEEIGSNRNTVNKAYKMLIDMGIIRYTGAKRNGFTVHATTGKAPRPKSELKNYFYQHAVQLVWEGMAAGMTSEEMLDQLQSAVTEVIGNRVVNLIFFECNDNDTTEMGRELNKELKIPVKYRNLSELMKDPEAIFREFDLVITTYHHLAEISTISQQFDFPQKKIVGIDTRLTPDSMVRIARFPKSRIGVVCTNHNTAHRVKHILYGYHPEWDIEAIAMGDPEALQELCRRSDHVVATLTCADDVTALTGRAPDVVVHFQIDEQSVALLNQRITQIRLEKMQSLQSRMDARKS